MVLWSAQGMSVAQIAGLAFTSEDRVRDVLHNFNADGFESLYPRYAGGRPPVFTLAQRREIKKIAKSKPAEYGLPFSRWSLAKLADFLVAEGVVEDTSHEALRGTAARGERLVSGREDLESLRRPGLRGEEGAGGPPVRHRRRRGGRRARRPGRGLCAWTYADTATMPRVSAVDSHRRDDAGVPRGLTGAGVCIVAG